MIELHSPDSETELMFLKSLLDEAGIPFFVHNERFGSLLAGPQIALYNRKTIWVHRHDREEASALVGDFLRRTGAGGQPSPDSYSLSEKLRMIGEFLLFGWFLPGRRPRRRPRLRLVKGCRTGGQSHARPPGASGTRSRRDAFGLGRRDAP